MLKCLKVRRRKHALKEAQSKESWWLVFVIIKDKKGRKTSEEVEEIDHLFDYSHLFSHYYHILPTLPKSLALHP